MVQTYQLPLTYGVRARRSPQGGFCISRGEIVDDAPAANRTRAYIDGFNFYRGAFDEGPFGRYKWLDIAAYVRAVLVAGDRDRTPKCGPLDRVTYFTATVDQNPNRDRWTRQNVYLQALDIQPDVQLVYGRHQAYARKYRLFDPADHDCGRTSVEVLKPEEKESDVNLASRLLLDGFRDEYDTAVLITDDSDFVGAIRVVREELKKRVVVVKVRPTRRSVLKNHVDSMYDGGQKKFFAENQLPVSVKVRTGNTVVRPASWDPKVK